MSQSWMGRCWDSWDRFWFTKADPLMLATIRLIAGAILFYTHVVWTFELESFFSNDQLLSQEHNRIISGTPFCWSHFNWMPSFQVALVVHWFALAAMLLFCLGLFTRLTGLCSLFFAVSYANRAMGATFGLDQINVMLTFYCVIGPSGAVLSLDDYLRRRSSQKENASDPGDLTVGGFLVQPNHKTVMANLTVRLIQIHLCIIYLFAGWGKLMGSSWWNGEAIWGAMANAEYQTVDMTWLAEFPFLINLITLVALAWEASYVFLVWQRWSRPIVLGMAIMVHLGIGIAMGMMEFGLVMVTANLAFIHPDLIRRLIRMIGWSVPEPD